MLLANIGPNSEMTPKIVNGSFAALFDNSDVQQDFYKRIQQMANSKESGKSFHTYKGTYLTHRFFITYV